MLHSYTPTRHAAWLRGLVALFLLVSRQTPVSAQSVTNYVFAGGTPGTYTALSGGTTTAFSGSLDEGYTGVLPIGFPVVHNGVVYTSFSASTNGFMTLGNALTAAAPSNNLSSGTPRPIIAPLWDDLNIQNFNNFSYSTTGSAGSRVLTAEWLNTKWNFNATGNTISFQAKLYEADGRIEFVYRQDAASVVSGSASIGITAVGTGSGNFRSLNGTGTAPTASSTSETTTLSAKPATGQVYTFTPPATVPTAPTTLAFSAVSYATMTVGWTDNSTTETGFGVLTSTDNVTFTAAGNVTSTTSAGTGTTYSLPLTGLTPGTPYFVRVVAVTEGRASSPLNGSQSTLTPITFSGTAYTINNASPTSGTNFNNFTDAFAALNFGTVTANTTINVVKNSGGLATYDEAPLRLTQTGTSGATITFVSAPGNASNPIVRGTTGTLNSTATGGDAVIRLVGSDYVTFDGIDLADNPSNATATTRMESGLLLDGILGASGCQNNTFRNATITLNKLNSNTPTGIQVSANATSAAGANSNNSFRNVTITNAARGYSLNNGNATFPDLNNSIDVTGGGTSLVYDLGGASAGPIQGVEVANQSGVQIKNTTFRDFASATAIYGIGSTVGTVNTLTVQSCKFSNLVNSTAAICAGIYITAHSSATPADISNCQIEPISPATVAIGSSVSGAALYGVFCTSGSANVFGNRINNIVQSSTLSGGAGVIALNLTGGATFNVARNAIHTIVQSAASGSFASGITIAATTANVSNNLISNIRYDRASGSAGVRAIVVNGGTNINLYYNTVYLTGTAAVTNHQSAALYLPSNSGTTVDYRNNIFFNNYTGAGGTLKIMAIFKTSGTVNNPIIATTTNNNLVYGATGILENSGTVITTLTAYRAALNSGGGSRESLTVTESTTPFAGATDPHLTTATNTQAEAGGAVISGFEDDFDALNTRLATSYPKAGQANGGGQAPDIGADEGDYKPLDLTAPMIVVNTPLANTISVSAPTLTNVTITDPSGVNVTPGTKPRVYYKLSTDANTFNSNTSATAGWKYVEATGTTSPFSFTLDYSLLPSAPVGGTTIQYFVTAQDLATVPNVGIDPASTFAALPAGVNLTSAAFPIGGTPLQFSIQESFSGTISVGPGQTYNGQPLVSLTAAGGLFARLNSGALSGNLTVLITGDISVEDGANVLRPLNEVPAASNFTISIQPSAATVRTITGASNNMATGIRLTGADRVTFDGRFGGSGKYLTFRNTSTTNSVFLLEQDATNNVLRNITVEGGGTSGSVGAVTIGNSQTSAVNGVTAGVTGNDANALIECDVTVATGSSLDYALYSSVPSVSTASNSSITLQDNNFYNWRAYGVFTATGTGSTWTVSGNSFYQTATTTATSQSGMNLAAATGATGWSVTGNYIGGTAPLAAGTAWVNSAGVTFRGIHLNGLGTGTATPSVVVQNNVIGNIQLSSASSTFTGIEVKADATSYQLIGNTIENATSAGTSASGLGSPVLTGIVSASTASSVTAGTAQLISGNIIRNLASTGTGTGNLWVAGILVKGTAPANGAITRNRIYGFTSAGTTAAAGGPIGLHISNGDWVVTNNQITFLAPSPTGANIRAFGIIENSSSIRTDEFYFNTVLLAGTSATGSQKTYAFQRSVDANTTAKNNIFLNRRTGGGGNFAIGFSSTNLSSKFVADYNDLLAADPTKLAENNTTALTWAAYKAITPVRETNGKNVEVKFVAEASGNLNLDAGTNCQLDNTGVAVTGINGEYDNAATSRAGTPDIGSDEFTYTPLTASIDPPAFTCTATTASVTIGGANGPWTVVYTDGTTPVSTPNVTASPFTFPAALGFTYTLVSVTDAYGCALNVSGSLTTTTTTTWTGAVDLDWYNPGNWTACVPSATIDAVIPTGFTVNISSGTGAARNLDVQGTSVLAVNTTGNLEVYGTFTLAAGTSYQPTVGTTTFKGSGAQPIPGAAYVSLAVEGTTAKPLTGAATVASTLDLTSGLIDLGNFDLLLQNSGSSVVGASPAHFCVVSGTGRFGFAQVGSGGASSVLFPIGTTSSPADYNPVTLANTGTQDTFWARVTDVTPVNPAAPVPAGPRVVKKTWDVAEVVAGGTNATLTLAWDASDEGTAFDRANCGISHFTGGIWDLPSAFVGATALGGTRYAVSRTGLTSFSPFAVEDNSQPLPVELARFVAVRKGQNAELTWATASEKNNRGFDVQVSTNGTDFRTLAFVASRNPNSPQLLSYAYLDQEAGKSGVRFYRLKQIDLNGVATLSPVRSVTFDAATVATSVQASPNPFSAHLNVQVVALAPGTALLTLTDALGRDVFRQQLPVATGLNTLTPNLSNASSLTAGAYILRVTVDGQTFRSRLVKE